MADLYTTRDEIFRRENPEIKPNREFLIIY